MRCSCGHENADSAACCGQCGRVLATGWDRRRLVLDVLAAGSLLLALALVWLVDRRTEPVEASPFATEPTSAVVELPSHANAAATTPSSLRLAVTPNEFDDMEKLLDSLGSGYRSTKLSLDALLDADRLDNYDVIFLTCGGVPSDWLLRRPRDVRNGVSARPRPAIAKGLYASLRKFVGHGGTLYASDWRFQILEIAFPEFADSAKTFRGARQNLVAQVLDPGLKGRLGATTALCFDQANWFPASFKGRDITVCLEGPIETTDGQKVTRPLMVTFPFEQGMVIFTSFHNEKQNSQTELELLRYLVFTTVTAREDAKIKRTMVQGGFSPSRRDLLSASASSGALVGQYVCPQGGSLEFVLGFEDQGAELMLSLAGPGGVTHERTGSKTFQIDVRQAAAGTWRYTVKPVKIPYQNFPFTVTIGEKH